MDDAAYRILRDHVDPDRIDPQLDEVPDARPDLPATTLLEILTGYKDQSFAHTTGTGEAPQISPLEALAATRVLVEDLTGAYRWLINDARQDGSSWSQIGAALRMSKQAAWERAETRTATAPREHITLGENYELLASDKNQDEDPLTRDVYLVVLNGQTRGWITSPRTNPRRWQAHDRNAQPHGKTHPDPRPAADELLAALDLSR